MGYLSNEDIDILTKNMTKKGLFIGFAVNIVLIGACYFLY